MLRFKRFVSEMNLYEYSDFLTEELTDEQKEKVNHWQRGKAEQISSHVIPEGQDRISIPFHQKEDKVIPHPSVEDHLAMHGYDIHDYKEGTATKQGDKRVFKIGKVLNSTKADKDTINAFQNDPARSGKQAKYHIVISRHPHDVAGMSTNQGWTSCMNMEKGCNRHYLQHDVERGTHVAYLAHADDHAAKKPVARVALKPFHPEDKTKKTILRPEPRVYGTASPEFLNHVQKWSNEHFPLEKTHYKKDYKLYHDAGSRSIINTELAVNSKDEKVRKSVFNRNRNVTPEQIHQGLSDQSHIVRKAAILHPNATAEHLDKALNDPHHTVRKAVFDNENATQDNITKGLNDPHASVRQNAISHRNATSKHIDKALEDKNANVRRGAFAYRPNNNNVIQIKHMIKGANDKDVNVRRSALQQEHVPANLINSAVDDKADEVRSVVARHPHLSDENLHKLLSDKNKFTKYLAADNPNLKQSHVDRVINSEDIESAKNILQALDMPKNKDKRNMITKDHMDRLYNIAIAPDEHEPSADELNKGDFSTKWDYWHKDHPKSELMKEMAFHHGDKLSREQWEEMADHPSHRIRAETSNIRHTPKDILEKLSYDPVEDVRKKAQQFLEYINRHGHDK